MFEEEYVERIIVFFDGKKIKVSYCDVFKVLYVKFEKEKEIFWLIKYIFLWWFKGLDEKKINFSSLDRKVIFLYVLLIVWLNEVFNF